MEQQNFASLLITRDKDHEQGTTFFDIKIWHSSKQRSYVTRHIQINSSKDLHSFFQVLRVNAYSVLDGQLLDGSGRSVNKFSQCEDLDELVLFAEKAIYSSKFETLIALNTSEEEIKERLEQWQNLTT